MFIGEDIAGKARAERDGAFSTGGVDVLEQVLTGERFGEHASGFPPALISICMFGVIHTMDPPSVMICSPLASPHVTTGNVPPLISYLIVLFLFCHLFSVVAAVRGVCGTSLMDLQQTA